MEADELAVNFRLAGDIADSMRKLDYARQAFPTPPEGFSVEYRATVATFRRIERMALELASELAAIS